jgi:hypothetical protein
LVYSIHDSTEVAIQKMIDASQRILAVQSQVQGQAKDGWGINAVMKKHLELEIRTLKCTKRCRKVQAAVRSKAKTKGRSYAH